WTPLSASASSPRSRIPRLGIVHHYIVGNEIAVSHATTGRYSRTIMIGNPARSFEFCPGMPPAVQDYGGSMAYIITEPCVGTCDPSCVKVCPVDCIHADHIEHERKKYSAAEFDRLPEAVRKAKVAKLQLYIDPETCIDCGACEPECPVDAIFEADSVPDK